MPLLRCPRPAPSGAVCAAALALLALASAASDHSDAPVADGARRQDANLTDLYAFAVASNLVLALATHPAIPSTAESYGFPSDVTFEIHVDVDSPVSLSDPCDDGGTVLDPDAIRPDVTFRIRFGEDGAVKLQRIVRGAVAGDPAVAAFFTGLRDDPFIRTPRQGRNVAAIVLEVPLDSLVPQPRPLLIWATAKVHEFDGPFQDMVGRALRSMFPEQQVVNTLPPRKHEHFAGLSPDVMIYDPSRPAAFPNGRALTDDVVDLVCDGRVAEVDGPDFPTTNDVPFLESFPYLAPPHPTPTPAP